MHITTDVELIDVEIAAIKVKAHKDDLNDALDSLKAVIDIEGREIVTSMLLDGWSWARSPVSVLGDTEIARYGFYRRVGPKMFAIPLGKNAWELHAFRSPGNPLDAGFGYRRCFLGSRLKALRNFANEGSQRCWTSLTPHTIN